MREIDLRHMGVARAICCYQDEDWLIDPGPESTFETLMGELEPGWEPRRILLTHIHFDHAGATGRLVERFPEVEVYVHRLGAPHIVDPERLVRSARRLYGEAFDELWGEVVPVPEDRVHALDGGEELDGFRVAYTPGHARHHVAYLHEATQIAYCGDVAGVRIIDGPVLPPTPPPDVDLEAWKESIEVLKEWNPKGLALTHWGVFGDVSLHLEELQENIDLWGRRARELDEATYTQALKDLVEERTAGPVARAAYARANPPSTQYPGLARYWAKRDETASGPA